MWRDRRPVSPVAWAAIGIVAALALTACQATVHVAIAVDTGGRGTLAVTLTMDKQAALYASAIQVSDLRKAGWSVSGPATAADGSVTLTVSKGFSDNAGARAAVAQLSGSSGPFHDLRIVTKRSLFKTTSKIDGTVDLSCGIGCFIDPALQHTLQAGPGAGLDPARLGADSGVDVNQLAHFNIGVRLGGKMQANAPLDTKQSASWSLSLGQKVQILASSETVDRQRVELVVGSGGVLTLGIAVLLILLLLRRRRRHRPAHAKVKGQKGKPAAGDAVDAVAEAPSAPPPPPPAPSPAAPPAPSPAAPSAPPPPGAPAPPPPGAPAPPPPGAPAPPPPGAPAPPPPAPSPAAPPPPAPSPPPPPPVPDPVPPTPASSPVTPDTSPPPTPAPVGAPSPPKATLPSASEDWPGRPPEPPGPEPYPVSEPLAVSPPLPPGPLPPPALPLEGPESGPSSAETGPVWPAPEPTPPPVPPPPEPGAPADPGAWEDPPT